MRVCSHGGKLKSQTFHFVGDRVCEMRGAAERANGCVKMQIAVLCGVVWCFVFSLFPSRIDRGVKIRRHVWETILPHILLFLERRNSGGAGGGYTGI